MSNETIGQLAYFFGMLILTLIGAAFNQRHTNKKLNARNETLTSLKETSDQQAKQISSQNEEIESLREDLKEVRAERDKANSEVGKLQTQIDNLRDDIKKLQQTNTQAAQDLMRLTNERNDAQKRYQEKNEEHNQSLQEVITLGKTIGDMQDEMDELKIEIAGFRRMEELAKELTAVIVPAIQEGVRQALATGEMMKAKGTGEAT